MVHIVLNDKELSIYQGSLKTIQYVAFEMIKTINEMIKKYNFYVLFYRYILFLAVEGFFYFLFI